MNNALITTGAVKEFDTMFFGILREGCNYLLGEPILKWALGTIGWDNVVDVA